MGQRVLLLGQRLCTVICLRQQPNRQLRVQGPAKKWLSDVQLLAEISGLVAATECKRVLLYLPGRFHPRAGCLIFGLLSKLAVVRVPAHAV